MTLIPIAHARRLASAAEAEAFFRGLGPSRVSARGFHTHDPARIGAVIAAIDPKRDHTVSWAGGSLAEGHAAFDALALAPYEYLDVRSVDGDVRLWPGRQHWVHSTRDAASAMAALGLALEPGVNVVDGARITVNLEGHHYPIAIEADTAARALAMFHAMSSPRLSRSFISGVSAAAKPLLVKLLDELEARVDAVLDVDLATARALTEVYAGAVLDWQADMILVDFPDGLIHGFLTTPKTDERAHAAWQRRVAKALAKAKLAP